LTAEVFSEKIEKSLYVVQCSQLGIEVNSIEEKLQATLKRAERWGSILLIDEADVYIRDRGNDIVHNAIVGVFLRLIEYYNGILFLTSNRGDIIDDAIISRATAWIRYSIPDDKLLRQIWQVLSAQFKVDLNDVDILNLVSELPNISGRTVKNLLKLVKALEAGDTRNETSVEKILRASKFQKLDQANPKA
jgi:AAA+ superfamily predicted ATPase